MNRKRVRCRYCKSACQLKRRYAAHKRWRELDPEVMEDRHLIARWYSDCPSLKAVQIFERLAARHVSVNYSTVARYTQEFRQKKNSNNSLRGHGIMSSSMCWRSMNWATRFIKKKTSISFFRSYQRGLSYSQRSLQPICRQSCGGQSFPVLQLLQSLIV